MKLRFPYPGEQQINYYISQGYDSNPINPETGGHYYPQHHGGMDIVPLTHAGGNFWPAPIFPVLDGKTVSVSTTDIDRGLGIAVETVLDSSLIAYFKDQGCIPQDYMGTVTMHHLYWHCLQVTDLDGHVDENTSVGLTGNSGYLFAGGLPVPASQKNKPPYPGGHLHFEFYLFGTNGKFNLDKDAIGRINPEILFNYKGDSMQLVEHEGTYYQEGSLGYYGINHVEYLNMLLKIVPASEIQHRLPVGNQLGIVETEPTGFLIKIS